MTKSNGPIQLTPPTPSVSGVIDRLASLSRVEQEKVVREVLLCWFDGQAGSLTLARPDSETVPPQPDFLIRYAGPPITELVVDDGPLSPEAAELVRRFRAGELST
jgi:hypothetical protein